MNPHLTSLACSLPAFALTLLSAALTIGCEGAGPDLVPSADADVMMPWPDGGVSPDAGVREDQGAVPVDLGSPPVDLGDVTDTAVPADDGVPVDQGAPLDQSVPDSGNGMDGGTDGGVDPGPDGGMSLCAPPTPGVVRFVALGDGGEGNEAQYQVGQAMADLCCTLGCDLALYLGDNFYDDGVSSLEDMQFDTKFELPYADLDIPFYVVLGNHDSGGLGGAGFEFWRGAIQVDYTNVSDKWTMPNEYYAFVREHVTFVGLDTNALMWGHQVSEQREFVADTIDAATTPWVIAFGHHPYISNGKHGDAGAYEGIPGIPILSGGSVKSFFDDEICGRVDLYLSGHDHNRQWLPRACDTQLVVSGAAAKTTGFRERAIVGGLRHNGPYNEDDTAGFFWGEIDGDTLRARFYDRYGTLNFETTMTR